jgi:hypothetical protein
MLLERASRPQPAIHVSVGLRGIRWLPPRAVRGVQNGGRELRESKRQSHAVLRRSRISRRKHPSTAVLRLHFNRLAGKSFEQPRQPPGRACETRRQSPADGRSRVLPDLGERGSAGSRRTLPATHTHWLAQQDYCGNYGVAIAEPHDFLPNGDWFLARFQQRALDQVIDGAVEMFSPRFGIF